MKKLLIAVAINEEFKVIKKHVDGKQQVKGALYPMVTGSIGGYPVDVVMTSMGMDAAYKTACDVITPEKYAGVLVIGYCGGLSLTLKIGDSVIPAKIMGPEEVTVSAVDVEPSLCEKLGKVHCAEGLCYRNVPLITQKLVIETPADKQNLFQKTHAEAVDMESFEIARAARDRDVKSAVVKVVIDDVDTELPNFNAHFTKVGKMDHLGVTSVMMSAPALSLKLQTFMKRAAQVLHRSVPQIVPVACEHWGVRKIIENAAAP